MSLSNPARGAQRASQTIPQIMRICSLALVSSRPVLFHFGEFRQALAPVGLAQLEQPTCLDLPDPFSSDAIGTGNLIQGTGMAVAQAEAQFDDLALPGSERTQDFRDALLEQVLVHSLAWVG